jgi:hypothetical protein
MGKIVVVRDRFDVIAHIMENPDAHPPKYFLKRVRMSRDFFMRHSASGGAS